MVMFMPWNRIRKKSPNEKHIQENDGPFLELWMGTSWLNHGKQTIFVVDL